jgi:hypothetical protein
LGHRRRSPGDRAIICRRILADPIAQSVGLSRTTVFGLFSGALLLSALLGPAVGRAIDNRGGRGMLALSNLVLATGLVLLGVAQGLSLWLSPGQCSVSAWRWAFMIRLSPPSPGYTAVPRADRLPASPLIAGFASTVGWPPYLEAGGTLENAQAMAAHESPRTTKLYDRTDDAITLDEVERITI